MASTLTKAILNVLGVDNDMSTLSKWIREELFFVLIHDLKKENDHTMSVSGPLCSKFVKTYLRRENRSSIVNPDINGASNEDMEGYLRHLWSKGISSETKGKANIRKNLSLEKTAVYAAINDAFKTLMIDCIIHGVPFPAFETFEDCQNLPKRFFLFFERFFKAGRHNKELWAAAIERNNGKNTISFGTCIFEAHVRTTLRENYFTWMYQALTSPLVIPEQLLKSVYDFKTEYDLDQLPLDLACNCKLISPLVSNDDEYRYNISMRTFETLSVQSQKEEAMSVHLEQKRRLQELVDSNKEDRRKTLSLLRGMVDKARPVYTKYTKEEKNEFNSKAKRKFRLFTDDNEKENEINQTRLNDNELVSTTPIPANAPGILEDSTKASATTTTSIVTTAPSTGTTTPAEAAVYRRNKRQKRTSPPQIKCRVSKEKLDAFKTITDNLIQEKHMGIKAAWEGLYKKIINLSRRKDEAESDEIHKPTDFLFELEELDNDWKTQPVALSENVERNIGELDPSLQPPEWVDESASSPLLVPV